jgi:hypothetical protein
MVEERETGICKVAAVSTDPHRDAMAKMMVLGRKALVRM